jgi:hypothetical protein
MQEEDERCCGTGTCILNTQGLCWCGQQWDGQKMCNPATVNAHTTPALALDQAEQEVDFE